MANAGITFDFAAESAKLRGEIDKVRKELSTISAAAKGVEKGFKLIGGVIAGAFSIGAITGFLSKVNSAADQLNDMSTRLGASASGLQVLQVAAQQAGGSAEGMGQALSKLQNTIGEGLAGNKAAATAFKQLGLSASELAGLKTDEAMTKVLVALEGVANANERARIGTDLLGKGFKENAGLAADATAQLANVNQALIDSGAAIDNIDVAKIGVMNDELALQGTIVQNLGTKFLANLSPAVGVAVDSFAGLISNMGGATEAGKTFGTITVAAIKIIEAAVYSLAAVFEALRAITATVFAAIANAAGNIVGFVASAAEAVGLGFADNLRAAADSATSFGTSFANVAASAKDNAQAAAAAAVKAATDMLNAGEIFAQRSAAMVAQAEAAAARAAGAQGAIGVGVGGGAGAAENPFANGSLRTDDIRLETVKDPFTDPKYLYQQQLGTALADLAAEQSTQQLGIAQLGQQSILDSLLLNNEYLIAAEQAKNVTLGASLTELVGMAMQQGGALGKFGKAYAIAQTIWSTGTAIMNAMAQVPYPANLAAAAGIAIKGAMQLANIKKTNIGAGGSVLSGAGGGVGGSTPALPDRIGATAPAQDTRQSASQVIINGNVFSSQETADWIISQIRDAVATRDTVFIDGNSRQAMELRA